MSRSSPVRTRTAGAAGPVASLYRGLSTEATLILAWAFAPVRRFLETLLREGARPPTIFPGLPPGQFPPIGALRDELRPFSEDDRAGAAIFDEAQRPAPGAPGRSRECEPS
jgi:hypothetical protein